MENNECYFGYVEWFKVYGFISWNKDGVKQQDMFVHYSDISDQNGYRDLKAGQQVSFEIGKNHANEPKAVNVHIIK